MTSTQIDGQDKLTIEQQIADMIVLADYPDAIRSMPSGRLNDDVLSAACLLRLSKFDALPTVFQTTETAMYCIRKAGYLIKTLPRHLLTEDLANEAVTFSYGTLRYIPAAYRTERVLMSALSISKLALSIMNKDEQTLSMAKLVAPKAQMAWLCDKLRPDLLTPEVLALTLVNRDVNLDQAPADAILKGLGYALDHRLLEPALADFEPDRLLAIATETGCTPIIAAEAVLELRKHSPEKVSNFVDNDRKADIYKRAFGVDQSMRNIKKISRARKWLAEDMGL